MRPGERNIEDPTDRAPFASKFLRHLPFSFFGTLCITKDIFADDIAAEHAGLELNTPIHFFPDAITRDLPSGGRNIIGPIPGDFFTVTLTTDLRDLRNVYGQNVIIPPARGNTAEY